MQVEVIYIDYSKIFDHIDHLILPNKLYVILYIMLIEEICLAISFFQPIKT